MKRCLKCPGCLEYQKQWAAFGAAIANAETKNDEENWKASWNAYKEDNVQELSCSNPTPA